MLRTKTVLTGPTINGGGLATMYFNAAGGDTAAGAQAVASATGAFWQSLSTRLATGTIAQVASTVEQIDPASGLITASYPVTVTGVAGTASGETLPPSTQGCIHWLTEVFVGGRLMRGKTFIPSTVEFDNTLGKPIDAYVDQLNDAAGDLIGSAAGDLLVYSPTHHITHNVTRGVAMNKWAILSSRRD